MNWGRLKQPPWRTIIPGFGLLALLLCAFWLWRPGLDLRDGRHDRGRNGIWIGHGWLGADEWFQDNDKLAQVPRFRNVERIRALATLLKENGITDVFPHLCPGRGDGRLPLVDDAQVERFLNEFAEFRVMPWIGGPKVSSVDADDPAWRARFASEVADLLKRHPRLHGVQLNVEPMPSGDVGFLRLLEETRAALPAGKTLSVAAYPPPTRWQPIPDVHWEESYFREVAQRSDHLAVMMYDTGLRVPKLYQRLMADWTEEILQWSEGKPVLLGVPTYDDAYTEYHRPDVEDLPNALLGIHAGLARRDIPTNYQGVAIYCEWETDRGEWEIWRERFLHRPDKASGRPSK